MSSPVNERPEDVLSAVMARAKAAGADSADALIYRAVSASVSVRLGEVEEVERSENRDLGLRVLVGRRQACVSTTDYSPAALDELAERAVAMARLAPEDPYLALADPARLASGDLPDLDLFDGIEPPADALRERALACEAAARDVEGVTNSSGANASFGTAQSWLATSTGFLGAASGGSHGTSVSVLAGEGTAMERDYEYGAATHLSDLRTPEEIGRTAGERAVRRLNPKKLASRKAPVVYEQRLAASLLGPLAGAINGAAIARGTSFLKNKLGQEIFASGLTVTDDPFVPRGFGSKPFDGEGVRPETLSVVEDGRLTTWLLNTAQAKQLGLETNGRAKRGTGGPPGSGATNLDLQPGTMSLEELLRDTHEGLYVTDMFGPQVNGNTGDYSVGCSGYWIENGEVAYPVSEITIAGNLLEMWQSLTPASDFVRRGARNAPTVRIAQMQIAGA
ncbi:TldD/PmbA family protein [Parvularcula dongshanensis]|uniref:PmbA protein n=1 Tax=Parvularcula dongshanensis TaxID=1173995 RepID=A0A840I2P7_9PROT|nr:TldD/PmbA family protein [Parvularcula dongshanensis]MBB4658504.1 PmbA protein [Parvularcula dongshanensis]